jgi:hypothetical protein
MYPSFTLELTKDPEDIVIKTKPKSKEDEKKVEGENKDEKEALESQQEKLLQ